MFLITGFGASGTMYTADIFQKLGYDVGHEKSGKDGVISWKHLPKYKEYDVVLHQVRHPLRVLGSAITGRNRNLKIILNYFPEYLNEYDMDKIYSDKLLMTMWAYFLWNQWAEQVSTLTYMIEDFDSRYKEIFKLVGLKPPKNLPNISKSINTHKHRNTYMNVTIDDLYERDKLLAMDILDMSLRYGYDL